MRQLRILILAAFLSACSEHSETVEKIDNSKSSPNAKVGKILPVTLRHGYVTNAFKNGIQESTVIVTVEGGTANDWAVTGILLAEKLAKLGNDEIEVYIDRNDLGNIKAPNMYKHYARVSYTPDLKRSFVGERHWDVSIAEEVVSIKMIEASNEYELLYQNYIDQGASMDSADKKAGAVIARKFKLDSGWRLPNQNLTTSAFSRNDFIIKADETDLSSINKIANCFKGKVNFTMKTCD